MGTADTRCIAKTCYPSVAMQQPALSSLLTSVGMMGIATLLNQALSLAVKTYGLTELQKTYAGISAVPSAPQWQ